jgi:hypothetical protein
MTNMIIQSTDLVESRVIRAKYMDRADVLDKVKALALCPDGIHATMQDVADYFEVEYATLKHVTRRNREELWNNGLVDGDAGRELGITVIPNTKRKPGRQPSTFFVRRTMLNVAMLLTESQVAEDVRTYLLNAEEVVHQQIVAPAQPVEQTPLDERMMAMMERINANQDRVTGLLDKAMDIVGILANQSIPKAEAPVLVPAEEPEKPTVPVKNLTSTNVWKKVAPESKKPEWFAVLQHVKVLLKVRTKCGEECYDAPIDYIRQGYLTVDHKNPHTTQSCKHSYTYFTEAGQDWAKEHYADWRGAWESAQTVPAIEGPMVDFASIKREFYEKQREMGL